MLVPFTHDIAIRAEASSHPLLSLGLVHSEKGAWGVNGTSKSIAFELGVLLGVAEGPELVEGVTGDMVGLGVRIGLGVALGFDSKPGSELVRVAGLLIDLKAKKEIKIPAASAVTSKIKYNGTFFIF